MRAVIEKKTALIMHEIVLYFVIFVRNIHDRRQTVNVQLVAITTHLCIHTINSFNRPIALLLSPHAIGTGGLGFKSRVGQMSPTARHRCDVYLELCSPGAKPRRWAPPLVYTFRRNTASIMKI